MSFCVDCGFELEEGANFCVSCGKPTGSPDDVFQKDLTRPVCGNGSKAVQGSDSEWELRCNKSDLPLKGPSKAKDPRVLICLAIGLVMMAVGIAGDLAILSDYGSIPFMVVAVAGFVTFTVGFVKLIRS